MHWKGGFIPLYSSAIWWWITGTFGGENLRDILFSEMGLLVKLIFVCLFAQLLLKLAFLYCYFMTLKLWLIGNFILLFRSFFLKKETRVEEVGDRADRWRSFLNPMKYKVNFAQIDIVLTKLLQNLKWKKFFAPYIFKFFY